MAITMENVKDAWVRRVIVEHFAGSAVFVLATASQIIYHLLRQQRQFRTG
jgi:hypothetical protein